MKRLLPILAFALILIGCNHAPQSSDMDEFITRLMAQMTIEEKLGQLNLSAGGDITTGQPRTSNTAEDIRAGKVGGLFNIKGADQIREVQRIAVEESRLSIPLIFAMDVIHGYETVFPIPLALACTWDLQSIEQSARIAAIEATADGICWTFSPMVDISHDARWGRISESAGEDPFLGARIAEAMVHGYQGTNLADPVTMLACVKHFALYGAVEAGREYNFVDMSRYRMFNEYFAPYEAAVNAGAGSVMASFNVVEGVPAHGNKWLLTDVLRNKWGFGGFVVADYCGVEQLKDHGMKATHEQAAIQALNAGLDMDMVSNVIPQLAQAVRQGLVSETSVNQACRRILEAKYKLGLFEDPYRYCNPNRREKDILSPEHREQARRIATESMVLLKNDNNILPLKKQGTIALIGPLAATRANMPGTWAVAAVPEQYKTVQEGLQDALIGTNARLLYAKGSNLMYDPIDEANCTMFGREMRDPRTPQAMRQEAMAIARQADVILCAMGEASESSGESSSRVGIELYDAQRDLLDELIKLNKPIVLLHFAGRPTVLNWETEHLPAIIETWFAGSETADAIADIVFGDANPSGHLCVQLPRHVGQYPFSYRKYRSSRPNEGGSFAKFSTCYMDVESTPLYPFGFGMSYTTFDVTNPVFASSETNSEQLGTITTTITNTGKRDGATVVQLYLSDPYAEAVRPYIELCAFERVNLKAGETQKLTFNITKQMLGYYNPQLEFVTEPGEYQLRVGLNARDLSEPVIIEL